MVRKTEVGEGGGSVCMFDIGIDMIQCIFSSSWTTDVLVEVWQYRFQISLLKSPAMMRTPFGCARWYLLECRRRESAVYTFVSGGM